MMDTLVKGCNAVRYDRYTCKTCKKKENTCNKKKKTLVINTCNTYKEERFKSSFCKEVTLLKKKHL